MKGIREFFMTIACASKQCRRCSWPLARCECACHRRWSRRRERTMSEYRQYRRTQIAEMADWTPDFDMTDVSISEPDRKAGSPKPGDKIARNPANHEDKWLVAAAYFAENFEPLSGGDA